MIVDTIELEPMHLVGEGQLTTSVTVITSTPAGGLDVIYWGQIPFGIKVGAMTLVTVAATDPITAVRGEDYPALVEAWDNSSDAIFDDL